METTTIKRAYGKETTIGDIILNKETNTMFFSIDMGFMGRKNVTLIPNQDGTYDMFGTYFRQGDNTPQLFSIGKTFPVFSKDGQRTIIKGLTKGSIALNTSYSQELRKNIMNTNDALFITTHQLKNEVKINDNLVKIGWVSGQLGIEIADMQSSNTNTQNSPKTMEEQKPSSNVLEIDINEDEIPF